MKTLATCTPTEFLKQSNKIRHNVEHWLKATDIMNIRKRKPTLVPESGTEEEIKEIRQGNEDALKKQAEENLNAILDAIMEQHPEETIQLIAMCCFIEPEDADNHPVEEYLTAVSELIGNRAVIDFFTSLMKLGLMGS